jgi:hypothetical protein
MIKHTISSKGTFDISETCFTAVVIAEVTFAVVGVLLVATTPRLEGYRAVTSRMIASLFVPDRGYQRR